ncbi:MAG: PHP domain-containing protein [Spirochaetota bacterium]
MPDFEEILADLHNHSCLSPCGSLELSPSVLAERARARGIRLLALTDHNSALNTPAFSESCRREGITALFGIEACSAEEVHVLCLFGTLDDVLDFGETLRGRLPDLPYDVGRLGDQAVVDADENVLELSRLWLGAALDLDFGGLCALARSRGALVIPAHVDRPYMSVGSQLGFLPPGPYAAVESMRPPPPSLSGGHTVISGSDAHEPESVGRRAFLLGLPVGWRELEGRALLAAVGEGLGAGRVRAGWQLDER